MAAALMALRCGSSTIGSPADTLPDQAINHKAIRVDMQLLSVLPEVEDKRVKVFGDMFGSSLGSDSCEPMCGRGFRPGLRLRRSPHELTTKTIKDYEHGQWL